MTDYVLDHTQVLPADKVDGRTLAVPANQKSPASEWNNAMNAIAALRLAHQRQGVHVEEWGAVGDGATDDTAALQAAFDYAVDAGMLVLLQPGKTYKISAELRFGKGTGAYVRMMARGATLALTSVGVQRSVLRIDGDLARVEHLYVNANRCAQHGYFIANASNSFFVGCDALSFLVDGWHSDLNNDRCHYLLCSARVGGTIYCTSGYGAGAPTAIKQVVTGTVAKTNGSSPVLTFTGAPDMTTLGIRPGDWISTDPTTTGVDTAEWVQVLSVDSPTQITCQVAPASGGAASGLKFSIHVGDAYHEGPGRADNNINRLDTFYAENVAGSGLRFGGLYGGRVSNLQVNAAFAYPVTVGTPALPTLISHFSGVYFELCEPVSNFAMSGAAGFWVDTGNVVGAPYVTSGFSFGEFHNMLNQDDPGRADPGEGTTVSYLPAACLTSGQNINGVSYDGAMMRSKLYGRSYTSPYVPGAGYLQIAENQLKTWAAKAGVSWIAGAAAWSAYDFDTDTTENNGTAGADTQTKHLHSWRNHGAFKYGIGFLGDPRMTSTDNSGTPGTATTIDTPKGRFALAGGGTHNAITVTCACVRAGSTVHVTKESLDATAKDFAVTVADGSFTVTMDANATSDVKFRFTVTNTGS